MNEKPTDLTEEEKKASADLTHDIQEAFGNIADKHVKNTSSFGLIGGLEIVKQKLVNDTIELTDEYTTDLFNMATVFTEKGMTHNTLVGSMVILQDLVMGSMKSPMHEMMGM